MKNNGIDRKRKDTQNRLEETLPLTGALLCLILDPL